MILNADARNIPLRDGCVQTVVTSPPYWGLRDYGTARWKDGDASHIHGAPYEAGKSTNKGNSTTHAGRFLDCPCGAVRIDAQIGLEPTPEAYVATMVGVFREVRRVLRDDGTVWLNLGDSYFGSSQGWGDTKTTNKGHNGSRERQRPEWPDCGLKPKDLCGIPWRVAFALQQPYYAGRMPDKAARAWMAAIIDGEGSIGIGRLRYFYDADAIKEPLTESSLERGYTKAHMDSVEPAGSKMADAPQSVRAKANWRANPYIPTARNKRSVWTVNSEPTPEAHFATFPQKLIEPCILAGSRAGDLVLDPFLGSGTVGKVCERLGRKWVGLELSEEYISIAERRTAQMGFGL